jgi:hypothetical protein
MKKPSYPEYVPSVSEYVEAFKKIRPDMTDKQYEMLINHCRIHCHITTAQELAESVHFRSYRGINLQYGKLGRMLAKAMDKDPYPGVLFLFTCVCPKGATNKDWLLVLRVNVVLALEKLKWVDKKSDLFDPSYLEEKHVRTRFQSVVCKIS